jgi:hypothetical protein
MPNETGGAGRLAVLSTVLLTGLFWIPTALGETQASIQVDDGSVTVDSPGVTQLPFTIQRSGDANDGIRIELQTVEGGAAPAVPGQDYTPLPPGTELILAPGQTEATVDVEVFGDHLAPGSESTLLLQLTEARAFHPQPRLSSPGLNIPACCAPMSIDVLDLNGNGHLDIVTGNGDFVTMELYVGVQLGDGEGSFGEMSIHTIAHHELAEVLARVGDVTGNGYPDIVAGGFNSQEVLVFAGDGEGGFADPVSIATEGRRPMDIALADVTGNGHLDIVTANGDDNSVSILPADGEGGFGPIEFVPAGNVVGSVHVADLNGNGHVDIITANTASDDVSVLLADGSGGFQAAQHHDIGPDAKPLDVIAWDVTGNGHLDLLTANETPGGLGTIPPGTVSLLEGDGAGGFSDSIQLSAGSAASRLETIRIADVTGNGFPDLIVSQPAANSVTVLVGDGEAGFTQTMTVPTATGPNDLAIVDFTGDGNLDIVSSNFVGGSISVLPGDGQGNIGFPGSYATGNSPYRVLTHDLTGNGALDVITSNTSSDDVSVLHGDGSGQFAAPVSFPAGGMPGWIAGDDLNGNGHLDLVVGNGLGGSTISLLYGDGGGSFSAPQAITIAHDFQRAMAIATGDLNGNGHVDIVTVNRLDGGAGGGEYRESITVLLADGSGGFAEPVAYELSTGGMNNPQAIYLHDVTANGHLDIVTTNAANDNLSILEGDGAGEFAPAIHLATDPGPARMAFADVTGNGHSDIITLNHSGHSISVLAGDGTGQYAAASSYPIFVPEEWPCSIDPRPCPWPWGMYLGDVTGNGHLDVVTANTEQDTVTVMVNDGLGGFEHSVDFTTGAHPRDLVVADFNGNGHGDVLVVNNQNNSVSLLANLLSEVVLIGDEATGTIISGVEPGAPVLSLEPAELDFGSHEVGSGVPPLATVIANAGDEVLEVDAMAAPGAPFTRTGGDCPDGAFALSPGEDCELEYTFTPVEAGSFSASVTIDSNGGTATLVLAGIGTPAGEFEPIVELTSHADLGAVSPGQTATAEIQLANAGEAMLEIEAVMPPLPPFELDVNDSDAACNAAPFELEPGQSCSWTIRFLPEAAGSFEDSLVIQSNAASSPDAVVLTGSGIAEETPEAVAIPTLNNRGLLLLMLPMLLLGMLALRATGRTG